MHKKYIILVLFTPFLSNNQYQIHFCHIGNGFLVSKFGSLVIIPLALHLYSKYRFSIRWLVQYELDATIFKTSICWCNLLVHFSAFHTLSYRYTVPVPCVIVALFQKQSDSIFALCDFLRTQKLKVRINTQPTNLKVKNWCCFGPSWTITLTWLWLVVCKLG